MTRRTEASSRCSVSTRVITLRGAGELDGDEGVAEQGAQRVEACADQLVLVEAQPEHLASGCGTFGDSPGIGG